MYYWNYCNSIVKETILFVDLKAFALQHNNPL